MDIIEILTESFRAGITAVIEREKAEPEYLNSADFETSLARAKAGMDEAVKEAVEIAGYADAIHQRDYHGLNRLEEISVLESNLGLEKVALANEVEDYWNP